jgi:heptosyltransferase-2
VQTAFLGDLCLSSASLKRLRLKNENSPIWLVCRSGLGGLLKNLGLVDRVFEIVKGNAKSYADILKELKSQNFKFIISPHESLRTAYLVSQLTGTKKIGYHHWWNFLIFNERIRKEKNLPEAIRQLQMLRAIDLELDKDFAEFESTNWIGKSGKLLQAPPEIASGKVRSANKQARRNQIAIFPGSVWATKKWTEEGFSQLASLLAMRYQCEILLMGSAGEFEICERIKQQIKDDEKNVTGTTVNVRNLAGKISLAECLEQLMFSKLVISNDSGGSHLASLVDAPTISIFGPTVLEQGFRPWSTLSAAVFVENLACRPCGRHGHQKCPIGTHDCMKMQSAESIFQAAKSLLESHSV